MPSNKTIVKVVGAVAASTALVGTLVALRKRSTSHQNEDEDAFSSSPAVSKVKSPPAPVSAKAEKDVDSAATKAGVKESEAATAVADSQKTVANVAPGKSSAVSAEAAAASLLDEALKEIHGDTPATEPVAKSSLSHAAGGRSELPHLGISLKPPKGWEVREELSPVPNVAMVTIWNPEFANAAQSEVPGTVPVIILSVEDIRGENLTLSEFKDRSKDLSMQQMLMMTGGAIAPVLRKNTPVNDGPFRHLLEYAQSMPPFFDISVINLLEVRNGVAYVFQIMCSPKVMNETKPLFMQIARDMVLTPLTSSSLGYIDVHTGKVSVHIDSTWSWDYPESTEDTNAPLATFQLLSSVKKEEITLYETANVPEMVVKKRDEKMIDGVKITSLFDSFQETKLASYGDYTFVVRPLQKAVSFISEPLLAATIKSVSPSEEAPRPRKGASFVTPEYDYRFDVVGGSRVVSTKLGNGTVVYAPLGIPQDPAEVDPETQGPTVTIRIGTPENDPDCMGTLEEWHTRMQAESSAGGISDINIVKKKNIPCLSFLSKEMQEIGPGQRVEVKGAVFIFVRNGVTTLIRWETTTGLWRKYERDMNVFLESFSFLH